MTLGEKIKEARKQCGLSQEQLAEKMTVSRSAIAKWETDKGLPDVDNLKALAQLLNVSVDYLLDGGGTVDVQVIREAYNLCCHRNGTQKIATVSMVKKRCRPCAGSNCFGNWVSPLRRSGRCSAAPILWLTECGGI